MRFLENPRALRVLHVLERARSFVLRRETGLEEADKNLSGFYERVWREAALELGASIECLGFDAFEIRRGRASTRVLQNSTALDDLATTRLVRSKPVIYRLLRERGLPVPRHLAFDLNQIDRAAQFLASIGGDCVIKPAFDSGGGLGVTTGIRQRRQLGRASWLASRGGRTPLIEEQIEGQNIRLLYLDGQLLDAVVRKPPTLIADGGRTVAALVKAANQERLRDQANRSHSLLTFDMDLRHTLAVQGLSLRSRPPAGTEIKLKTAINENSGRENASINGLGTDLLAECAEAVRISGVRLAGLDIITSDPRVSLRKSGGVILEVNSPPGYFWHYHKEDGPFPVAVHALRALFSPAPAIAPVLPLGSVGRTSRSRQLDGRR